MRKVYDRPINLCGCVMLVLVLMSFVILVFKLVEVYHDGPHTLKVRHFSIKECHFGP
jgi:hypothetical protein